MGQTGVPGLCHGGFCGLLNVCHQTAMGAEACHSQQVWRTGTVAPSAVMREHEVAQSCMTSCTVGAVPLSAPRLGCHLTDHLSHCCHATDAVPAAHRIMPPNSKRMPFAKVEVASASAGQILSGYWAYMPSSYLNNLHTTALIWGLAPLACSASAADVVPDQPRVCAWHQTCCGASGKQAGDAGKQLQTPRSQVG